MLGIFALAAVSSSIYLLNIPNEVPLTKVTLKTAELAVTDKLFVEAYVSTNDISSITLGDLVVLTLNRRDSDITFEGTVSYIGDTATLMISPIGLE